MRKLQASDIFSFCRLVNEIGIKDEIKKIALEVNTNKKTTVEEAGYDLVFSVFEKAVQKKAEDKLFQFFAGIFEEDAQSVKKMDPIDFIDKILEAADLEKWKAFFSRVAALMK